MRQRLDKFLHARGLAATRSMAASLIKLGKVSVNDRVVFKTNTVVGESDEVIIQEEELFVSRGAYKLRSVTEKLKIDFKDKIVLDVGSSTGGFSDFALRRGARRVIAVDVGTDQLDPKLRQDNRLELHEKTDIRDFQLAERADIILIDVSFISLRNILPAIRRMMGRGSIVVALFKPQFEAGEPLKNRGVIKNDTIRRSIIKDFESWLKGSFVIIGKADSEVTGSKGNRERFYLLKTTVLKR